MDIPAAFAAAAALHNEGRLAEAEREYRAIIAIADYAPALMNLAILLDDSGRMDEAGQMLARAAAAAPEDARAQYRLAKHQRTVRDFAASEAGYRRTMALHAQDAAYELGMVLLAQGRFAEAWPLYEHRNARRAMLAKRLPFPEWRGEPLAGKRLLVWREQGFGDQIMAARFLPALADGQVTYAGHAALQRLFSRMPVAYAPVPPEGYRVEPHDYWTLPLSLPGRLGVATAADLPAPPYLFGEAAATGARIGVSWRGRPTNPNDRLRSLPAELGERLLALPGAISLEPEATGAADFQATADIIAGLDLVISVDSAVAHLAGAMGRPVWVLLAAHAMDWHWPREGVSPWYPQAQLFVQPRPGDWASVIDAVCAAAR